MEKAAIAIVHDNSATQALAAANYLDEMVTGQVANPPVWVEVPKVKRLERFMDEARGVLVLCNYNNVGAKVRFLLLYEEARK